MYFANNIRYLRKRFGYSQQDIADATGYSAFSTIQKWETGKSEPKLKDVCILADLFGVTMDNLVCRDLENNGVEKQIEAIKRSALRKRNENITKLTKKKQQEK